MGFRELLFKPSLLEGWPARSFTPVSPGLCRALRVPFPQVPRQLVLQLLPKCLHFSGRSVGYLQTCYIILKRGHLKPLPHHLQP